jgi:hypothetical protein
MSKWSNEEIALKADSEGLAYMVTDYLSADSIEDEELKVLWKQANDVLRKIEKILEPYLP